jgi:hypothetical protein
LTWPISATSRSWLTFIWLLKARSEKSKGVG